MISKKKFFDPLFDSLAEWRWALQVVTNTISIIICYILPCLSAYYLSFCIFLFVSNTQNINISFQGFCMCTFCLASARMDHPGNSIPFIFHSFLKLTLSDIRFRFMELQLSFLSPPSLCNVEGIYLEQFNGRPQSKLSTGTNNQFISISTQTLIYPLWKLTYVFEVCYIWSVLDLSLKSVPLLIFDLWNFSV